jgi:IS66 Orf2 like protein
MLSIALPGRIFVCTQPADMRKSFDGLAALVQQHLGCDPLSGDLFVFRSRRGDRVKLLWNAPKRCTSRSESRDNRFDRSNPRGRENTSLLPLRSFALSALRLS